MSFSNSEKIVGFQYTPTQSDVIEMSPLKKIIIILSHKFGSIYATSIFFSNLVDKSGAMCNTLMCNTPVGSVDINTDITAFVELI